MKNNVKIARPAVAALGLVALLGTVPAFAADVVMEAPPAPAVPMEEPPLNTWSGPYAGVSLGYGFSGETEVDAPIGTNTIGTDGFLLGGFAGYNWQSGNIVAGAEADIGYSWEEGSNAGLTSESGVEGSLRARLGYVVSPNVLLYATAGGAAKDLEVSGGGVSDSNTMIGWTAGAGADIMVTEHVFGRVEYRYTDFGSDTFTTAGGSADVDDKDHRVTFGLGMKF
ncbi:outer membrane protein [Mesorhizobium sp. YM1C-6-2]|uniref:outer membrane protein n=1 Tax=Mesorhizobium sp. YM1C-6-2 TaxID=1827501 RepID=UPI000EF17C51|nr:outer membrane protein [Mesorhizobium sp. YM1C-6-2]RLP22204.1 porin family protein [Mesorhizobium sp. YM1C-6-2]